MLPQDHMIARVRDLSKADPRVDAAMMYGSFTRGEGDAFSDIEFLLFFTDDTFPTLDRRAWIAQIAPVELYYVNDFGVTAVIFDNLIRGEFHFHRVSEVTIAQTWRGMITFPALESVVIVDKSGRLTPYLEPLTAPIDFLALPRVQFVVDNFVNGWLFGFNVLRRGELARALELLGSVQRQLLWLARAAEGKTANWPTPSKNAEHDLSAAAYARFAACSATLDPDSLVAAYTLAWRWGSAMLDDLQRRREDLDSHAALRQKIAGLLHTGG
jgi:lincosamide nucleotidyltransferase